MSKNLAYTKKFIILKKDFSNMNLQNPKGHGRIEIKGIRGNIFISLENAEEETYYKVLLIDKDRSYNLGKVYTEINGKGREDLAFNIQDLESSGFQINRLNGILICRDDNILLGGYMDKEDGSIEKYIKNIKQPIWEEAIQEEIIQEELVEGKKEEILVENEIMEYDLIQEEIEDTVIVDEKTEEEYQEEVQEYVQEEAIELQPIPEEELVQERDVAEEPIYIETTQEELIADEIAPLVDNESIPLDDPIIEETIEQEIIPDDPITEEEAFIGKVIEEEVIEKEVIEEVFIPVEDDFEPVFEPIAELSQEPEPIAQIEPSNKLEHNNLVEDNYPKFVEPNEAVIDIKLNQKNQTTNYILNILRYFPYIDPFIIKLEGYNWWKIDYEEEAKGFLPYFSYVVGGYQKGKVRGDFITAKRLMTVYSHYLFGLYNENDEVKYYIYGVPGGFFKDEHPYGGMTGFNTWFSSNDFGGYWLLYIDPMTGHIIYPINPMIPTN